jgi:hypothetical protein
VSEVCSCASAGGGSSGIVTGTVKQKNHLHHQHNTLTFLRMKLM